jgi:hypothetical protein
VILNKIYLNSFGFILKLCWGLGLGDWGLGIEDLAQSPVPNPQSPIPNPQAPMPTLKQLFFIKTYNK